MKKYLVVENPIGLVGKPEGADLYLVEREPGKADTVLLAYTVPPRYTNRGGWRTRKLRDARQELLSMAMVLNQRKSKVRTALLARIAEQRAVQLNVLRLKQEPKRPVTRVDFGADFGNLCAGERVGSFSPVGRVDGYW